MPVLGAAGRDRAGVIPAPPNALPTHPSGWLQSRAFGSVQREPAQEQPPANGGRKGVAGSSGVPREDTGRDRTGQDTAGAVRGCARPASRVPGTERRRLQPLSCPDGSWGRRRVLGPGDVAAASGGGKGLPPSLEEEPLAAHTAGWGVPSRAVSPGKGCHGGVCVCFLARYRLRAKWLTLKETVSTQILLLLFDSSLT